MREVVGLVAVAHHPVHRAERLHAEGGLKCLDASLNRHPIDHFRGYLGLTRRNVAVIGGESEGETAALPHDTGNRR